jgi:hypothetical protein
MKIRINGKTIDTDNIVSIGPVVERRFDTKIYFTFIIEYKNNTCVADSPLFKTNIYDGIFCTSYIPDGPEKSKEWWFKTGDFIKSLPQYTEVLERAKKMRNDIEILWDMNIKVFPIRDFNSY